MDSTQLKLGFGSDLMVWVLLWSRIEPLNQESLDGFFTEQIPIQQRFQLGLAKRSHNVAQAQLRADA